MSANAVPLANGAMSFDRVCREWRCKYTGDKATSESLEAIGKLVEEYLPEIKASSSDATVNRLVCGSCLDFKLMTTVSDILFFASAIISLTLSFYGSILTSSISTSCKQVPLDDFGPWEEKGFAPEGEFLEKLKAIEGVSQVETQTITNMVI